MKEKIKFYRPKELSLHYLMWILLLMILNPIQMKAQGLAVSPDNLYKLTTGSSFFEAATADGIGEITAIAHEDAGGLMTLDFLETSTNTILSTFNYSGVTNPSASFVLDSDLLYLVYTDIATGTLYLDIYYSTISGGTVSYLLGASSIFIANTIHPGKIDGVNGLNARGVISWSDNSLSPMVMAIETIGVTPVLGPVVALGGSGYHPDCTMHAIVDVVTVAWTDLSSTTLLIESLDWNDLFNSALKTVVYSATFPSPSAGAIFANSTRIESANKGSGADHLSFTVVESTYNSLLGVHDVYAYIYEGSTGAMMPGILVNQFLLGCGTNHNATVTYNHNILTGDPMVSVVWAADNPSMCMGSYGSGDVMIADFDANNGGWIATQEVNFIQGDFASGCNPVISSPKTGSNRIVVIYADDCGATGVYYKIRNAANPILSPESGGSVENQVGVESNFLQSNNGISSTNNVPNYELVNQHVNSEIMVQINNLNQNSEIVLYDMGGRMIKSANCNIREGVFRMAVSEVSSGIYILTCSNLYERKSFEIYID